jgi:peptidyl-prolyl cis-trans isomerase SurA
MTMTVPLFRKLSTLVTGVSMMLVCIALVPSPARAQQVVVMVNGEPITAYDIEQRTKLIMLSTPKPPERQQVINDLIDEKVKIKEGKKFSIDPSSSDIDQSFAQMGSRMHLSVDQLTKSLESKGVRPDTLKSRIKADMVWSNLVRGRYKESLQIGENDVEEKAKEQGATEMQGVQYKMQPVVLLVPRGSGADVIEARKKEAEAFRGRIQTCVEANSFFKVMRNATIRDAVTKTSADMPQALRDILDNTPVGHLTPPEITRQGVEMVVLCAKEPIKVDTPKKREIRDKMFADKFEAKSKAYLRDARAASMIEYPKQ